ncbi:MAG: RtcB family protein [Candidatus Brocadiia bacterium]
MERVRIDNWRLLIPQQGKMTVDATVYASPEMEIEDRAFEQLADVASLPDMQKALATPDIHSGFGAPIGTVAGLRDFICPSAVGYDVNCGMRLLSTTARADDFPVVEAAEAVSRLIPLGEGKSGGLALRPDQLCAVLEKGIAGLAELRSLGGVELGGWSDADVASDSARMEDNGSLKASSSNISSRALKRGGPQLGTLGGGNHFIEFQRVEEVFDEAGALTLGLSVGQLVVMIHSGSRGFGHQVGEEYMPLAFEKSKDRVPNSQLGILPVDSADGERYIHAMNCAANYAYANRQVMANVIRSAMKADFGIAEMPTVYDVPHNIAKLERHSGHDLWVHRKGATRAYPGRMMHDAPFDRIGQPILIPGSMGTSSWVLLGVEKAEESLFSVNHGAGRVMSRMAASGLGRNGKQKATAQVSDDNFRESMKGIHLICADRRSIKEEAPAAYKDIDEVIRVVIGAGLAKPVARMVPLAVMKG